MVQCKLDFPHGKQLYMIGSQTKAPLCTPILCIHNVNWLVHTEIESIHYEAGWNSTMAFLPAHNKQCNLSQNCYSLKKRTLNLRPQPAINSFGEKQITRCKPIDNISSCLSTSQHAISMPTKTTLAELECGVLTQGNRQNYLYELTSDAVAVKTVMMH